MPERTRKPKRPRDANQLAKAIVDLSTGEAKEPDPDEGKDPAAVALGRKGGLKGGKARAAKMTKKQRVESARNAANTRWDKKRKEEDSS
ncbi:MAG: histone H1 [Gammaproteobacteria bacterium]